MPHRRRCRRRRRRSMLNRGLASGTTDKTRQVLQQKNKASPLEQIGKEDEDGGDWHRQFNSITRSSACKRAFDFRVRHAC